MKIFYRIFIIILYLSLFQNIKADIRGSEFLNYGVGARALGMGGAYVSMADEPNAIFWNPAGLGFVKNIHLSTTFPLWIRRDILGYSNNYMAIAIPMSSKLKLGVALRMYIMEEWEIIRTWGDQLDANYFNQNVWSFTGSYRMFDDFAIGFTMIKISQGYDSTPGLVNPISDGLGLSIGLIYKIFPKFTVGTNINYAFDLEWSYSVDQQDSDLYKGITRVPYIGKAGFSIGPLRGLIISVDCEKGHGWKYTGFNIGSELHLNKIFNIGSKIMDYYLRGGLHNGLKYDQREERVSEGYWNIQEITYSLGLGLGRKYKKFSVQLDGVWNDYYNWYRDGILITLNIEYQGYNN